MRTLSEPIDFQSDSELEDAAKAVYASIYEDGLLLHKWDLAGRVSREVYGYDVVEIVYNRLLDAGRIVW